MSFQFSPETLIFDIDRQIQTLNDNISNTQTELKSTRAIPEQNPPLLLGSQEQDLTPEITASASAFNINRINKINSLSNQLGNFKSQISDLFLQRDLLEVEATARTANEQALITFEGQLPSEATPSFNPNITFPDIIKIPEIQTGALIFGGLILFLILK